ncbi:MAG: type VII toxin-antitoxin system HepT family RNase toxin [Planctomycetota bacterium]
MPTPPDDILLNKAAIIERCVRRMLDEARLCPRLDDFTHVDALTLNVERACQAAVDMAMHVVAERHLGVPQSTAEAFILLERAGLIGGPLASALCGMVGFRNVAVHQYEDLDMSVLRWIVEAGYRDWIALGESLGVAIRP